MKRNSVHKKTQMIILVLPCFKPILASYYNNNDYSPGLI